MLEYKNDRIFEILDLLDSLNLNSSDGNKVLDVGVGDFTVAKYLSQKSFKVTGIGLRLDTYASLVDKHDIEVHECSVENMPFKNESFDLIIMSHILEHCLNVGSALKEVRRVLKSSGKLIIFVPPSTDYVCAGHVSMGWSVGQLIYVLLVNGFDVKSEASFIHVNQSVAGIVKKLTRSLPHLRFDQGDIDILYKNNFFPFEIKKNMFDLHDSYDGKIFCINWPNQHLFPKYYGLQKMVLKKIVKKLFFIFIRLFPKNILALFLRYSNFINDTLKKCI